MSLPTLTLDMHRFGLPAMHECWLGSAIIAGNQQPGLVIAHSMIAALDMALMDARYYVQALLSVDEEEDDDNDSHYSDLEDDEAAPAAPPGAQQVTGNKQATAQVQVHLLSRSRVDQVVPLILCEPTMPANTRDAL
jgi:hypothetical protein